MDFESSHNILTTYVYLALYNASMQSRPGNAPAHTLYM